MLSAALQTQSRHSNKEALPAILLILVPQEQEAALKWMRQIAPALHDWCAIFCESAETFIWATKEWPVHLDKYFGLWRKKLQEYGRIDEIWLDYLPGYGQRVFVEAYPTARLFIFEDGLSTYFDYTGEHPEIAKSRSWLRRWRPFLRGQWQAEMRSHRLHGWRIPAYYSRRIAAVWVILGDILPLPECLQQNVRAIDISALKRLFDITLSYIDFHHQRRSSRPHVLLLPQVFARMGILSDQQEFHLYSEIVDEVIGMGWEVLWKDHPRADTAIGDELTFLHPDHFSRIAIPTAVPVDVVMAKENWDACLSAYSTSLFYAKYVHGIPVYTFMGKVSNVVGNRLNVVLKEAIREHIPDYHQMADHFLGK